MKSVLFVEDEAKLRSLMMQMAERSGFRALGAASGAEALAMIEAHEVDVAVLDMMLPDMTGLDLLGRFKTDTPELPAIILTAYASPIQLVPDRLEPS